MYMYTVFLIVKRTEYFLSNFHLIKKQQTKLKQSTLQTCFQKIIRHRNDVISLIHNCGDTDIIVYLLTYICMFVNAHSHTR